jgi:hypothetical protein
MNLFNELLHNFDHEGWNEWDIPKLKLKEIQFLCCALGAPKSGTKEKISIRLLAIRQVRLKISKYPATDEGVAAMVADFPKEPLKWMAKESGQWRSGNKKQLAIVLLNWRERVRVSGRKFLDQAFAAVAQAPRQLTFDL